MSGTKDVLLMIADISGYTKFMVANQTELTHSHEIIGALLEAILAEVEMPLTVAKFEGDAIFLYLVKENCSPDVLRGISGKLPRFFQAFSSMLREQATSRKCNCGACSNIDKLRLKVIAHSGRALIYSIANQTELAGVDVIIVHRLLKNSVPSDEYILLTDAAASDLELALPVLGKTTEQYEEIGNLNTTAYAPRN